MVAEGRQAPEYPRQTLPARSRSRPRTGSPGPRLIVAFSGSPCEPMGSRHHAAPPRRPSRRPNGSQAAAPAPGQGALALGEARPPPPLWACIQPGAAPPPFERGNPASPAAAPRSCAAIWQHPPRIPCSLPRSMSRPGIAPALHRFERRAHRLPSPVSLSGRLATCIPSFNRCSDCPPTSIRLAIARAKLQGLE